MCGITGIVAFSEEGRKFFPRIEEAVCRLEKRGPDSQGIFSHQQTVLGHTRLSIIDLSPDGSQPFTDRSGRYTIVFNGEFFNYREHRKQLEAAGVKFRSSSDTEVLLNMYIRKGPSCLSDINGFFALAIYDSAEEKLFLARDRYGIKPLFIFRDSDKFIFGSEMKSLLAYGIPRELDHTSLYTYLQLNYIPAPFSIFKNVSKVNPGSYLLIHKSEITAEQWYKIHPQPSADIISYEAAKTRLTRLLYEAVERRLVADVPVGSFLSGGVDSSVVSALAAQHTPHLKTFSIGFKDEPLFDETRYAQLVAKKFNTDHTTFQLTTDDLFDCLLPVLDYTDEPFADSSALAVYILSRLTRNQVKVALSGDGGDELFAGYNRHRAEYLVRRNAVFLQLFGITSPLWNLLPASRNSSLGRKVLQARKLIEGMKLGAAGRYWRWASYTGESQAAALLQIPPQSEGYSQRKSDLLQAITGTKKDLNDYLYTDMKVALANDMLVKVDLMSMANSLEVRVPILDYRVVDFAFSLPSSFKIDRHGGKKILKETFSHLLPPEILYRNKQGFEVPLLKWFRGGLKNRIFDDLLRDDFVQQQGIFDVQSIKKLKSQLLSPNPSDSVARIWGLIVFQSWWKKYMKL